MGGVHQKAGALVLLRLLSRLDVGPVQDGAQEILLDCRQGSLPHLSPIVPAFASRRHSVGSSTTRNISGSCHRLAP